MIRISENQAGFLLLGIGGTATRALKYLREPFDREGRPFPMRLLLVDTDPVGSSHADAEFFMPLSRDRLRAMKASPGRFGPTVEKIIGRYGSFLNEEDAQNGSRTRRLLTQLAYASYREGFESWLAGQIRELKRGRHPISSVIPVFFSSSGGGCGSAGQILLAQDFRSDVFVSNITTGFPAGFLGSPISFVAEPFAQAINSDDQQHANRILANCLAFRIESDYLDRQGRGFQYVFHLGMSNRGGAVLDSIAEVSKVLGTALYTFLRNWEYLKGRFVDTWDFILDAEYTGSDFLTLSASRADPRGHHSVHSVNPGNDGCSTTTTAPPLRAGQEHSS